MRTTHIIDRLDAEVRDRGAADDRRPGRDTRVARRVLRRDLRDVGLAWASIILGVIWAAWHLPLFFAPEADTYRQSFPVYALQVTGISVAMAWLYHHTRGSLLPAMLLHSGVNHFKQLVPSAPEHPAGVFALHASAIGWLTLAVLWAAALYFLIDMRRRSRSAA